MLARSRRYEHIAAALAFRVATHYLNPIHTSVDEQTNAECVR